MARHEGDVVAQRPELADDGIDQRRVIAAREIGASDRPLEQHIAHDRQACARVKEHHMAGRVAGGVDDLQRLFAEADDVAVDQPAVGLEGLQRRKAEGAALRRQLIDPELVVAVRAFQRYPVAARILGRLTAVVDVAVREEHLLQPCAHLGERLVDAIEVAARIEGRRPPGAGADQQRAVLLERRHRHDRQLQGWRIARVAGDLGTGGIGIHQEHSFGIGHRNATSWHQQLIEHPTVRIGQTDANRRQPVVVAQPDIDPWVARPVTVLT